MAWEHTKAVVMWSRAQCDKTTSSKYSARRAIIMHVGLFSTSQKQQEDMKLAPSPWLQWIATRTSCREWLCRCASLCGLSPYVDSKSFQRQRPCEKQSCDARNLGFNGIKADGSLGVLSALWICGLQHAARSCTVREWVWIPWARCVWCVKHVMKALGIGVYKMVAIGLNRQRQHLFSTCTSMSSTLKLNAWFGSNVRNIVWSEHLATTIMKSYSITV